MRDTIRGLNVRFPLRAVGTDAQCRRFPLAGVAWSSNNPAVATIDGTGEVVTKGAGRAEISVSVAGVTRRWTMEAVGQRRLRVDPFLATPAAGAQWELPVVVIAYMPTADGVTIDVRKFPDFWFLGPFSLDTMEQRLLDYARRMKMGREQGSRFRRYANQATLPSLGFRVVDYIVVYDHIPPSTKRANAPAQGNPRYPDYHRVFGDLQLLPKMRSERIKEVWVAGSGFDAAFPSHDPKLRDNADFCVDWESNMSSPVTGDVSNSDRDNTDLPIIEHTYTVYGIPTRRTQAQAPHVVGHQMEAIMGYAAHGQDGNDRFFWRDFVGLSPSGAFITGRTGWTHMPPNTTDHYDYHNATVVQFDIEDWTPNNSGQKKPRSRTTWCSLNYPWPGDQAFFQKEEAQW